MSLNSMNSKSRYTRLEKFNGNADKFPIFCKCFQALLFGLGRDYRRVLQERKPFKNMEYCFYDEESDDEAQDSDGSDDGHLDQSRQQKQPEEMKFEVDQPNLDGVDLSNPDTVGKMLKAMKLQAQEQLRAQEEYLRTQNREDNQRKSQIQSYAQDQDIQERYNDVCEKMYSLLYQYLGTEPIKKLENKQVKEGDGVTAWRTLKEIYQSGSKVNRRALLKQLSSLKMEGKLSKLTDYIYEFNRIKNILEDQEIKMPEDHLVTQLLNGLTEKYEQIRNILDTVEDLTLDETIKRLVVFNENNKLDTRKTNRSKNNQEQGAGLSAEYKHGHKRKAQCFNCGRDNHQERKCRAPCKICKAKDHTRYGCPIKKSRNKNAQRNHQPSKGEAYLVNAVNELKTTLVSAIKEGLTKDNKFDSEGVIGVALSCTEVENYDRYVSHEDAKDTHYGFGGKHKSNKGNNRQKKVAKLDSGCSIHSFGSQKNFDKKTLKGATGTLQVANGVKCDIIAEGKVGNLDNVRLVKGLEHNLISVGQLCDDNKSVMFTKDKCIMVDEITGDQSVIGRRSKSGLYEAQDEWLYGSGEREYYGYVADCSWQPRNPTIPMELLHYRLGHINYKAMAQAYRKGVITGVKLTEGDLKSIDQGRIPVCHACGISKTVKRKIPSRMRREQPSQPFQLICLDICGPITPSSIHNNRYYLVVFDKFSNAIWTLPLKTKGQAADKFDYFIKCTAAWYLKGSIDHVVRTDNAGELTEGTMLDVYAKWKLKRETTSPYSSHQNPAERAIRTVTFMARTIQQHSNAPESMWEYALMTAAYLLRRLPSSANPNNKTPCQMIEGTEKRTDVTLMRVFYAPVFVMKEMDVELLRSAKFTPRGYLGNFLTYRPGNLGYVVRTNSGRIINRSARYVYFVENLEEAQKLERSVAGKINVRFTGIEECMDVECESDEETQEEHKDKQPQEELRDNSPNNGDTPHEVEEKQPLRRSAREARGVPALSYEQQFAGHMVTLYSGFAGTTERIQMVCDMYTPQTYSDAIKCDESEQWIQAMNTEFTNMVKNSVFTEMKRPAGAKVVPSGWVYKLKSDENGVCTRFRARWVAKGWAETPNSNNYAPTLRGYTFRVFLYLIASKDLKTKAIDISAAFLHAELEEKTYLSPPPGYIKWKAQSRRYKEKHIMQEKNIVLRANKAIYGLRGSPKAWNQDFNKTMAELGFKKSICDECFFWRYDEHGVIYVICYVDDILCAATSETMLEEFVSGIKARYGITIGTMSWFLGLEIKRAEDQITISAQKYITDVQRRFNMESTRGRSTPGVPGTRLDTPNMGEEEKREFQNRVPFRPLLGCLMYISTCARPDITYAVNQACRYMSDPTPAAWKSCQRILQYLITTKEYVLSIKGNNLNQGVKIEAWTDADWGGNWREQDAKSTTGYGIYIGDNLIEWGSKKQRLVSLSTMEAELEAMVTTARAVSYYKVFFKEIGIQITQASIYCDNQACIRACEGTLPSARTRHFVFRQAYVRDLVEQKEFKVIYVASKENIADFWTKYLGVDQFILLRLRVVQTRKLMSDQRPQSTDVQKL